MALLWAIDLADGQHSILDMAERAGLPFAEIRDAAQLAQQAGLIEEVVSDKPRRPSLVAGARTPAVSRVSGF